MKTTAYNPSPIEIEMAEAISQLSEQLTSALKNLKVTKIEKMIDQDNPSLVMNLIDEDNDPHEVVLRIIQRPDKD